MPGLSAEGEILLLIAPAHDLNHFAVNLVEILLLAVHGLPGIQTVQRFRNAGKGRIGRLKEIPLLQLNGVLLIHQPCIFEELVPVVFDPVVLLNKSHRVLQGLS